MSDSAYGARSEPGIEKSVLKKVTARLLPFLVLMYVINYLDRANIGFAGPHGMSEELGLTKAAFGLAAGLFFVGYVIFEVPSNLLLMRFGASKWLARIMVSWGIVATLTALVQTQGQLNFLRVLLGIAEAGFTPGVLLYLTFFFPRAVRGKAIALFAIAIPLSSSLGSVMSAAIIQYLNGAMGIAGWRWMIFVEGVPAILVGIWAWFYLTDKPEEAKWLTYDERTWLSRTMSAEIKETQDAHRNMSLLSAFFSGRTLALVAIYLCMQYSSQAIGFFLPTVVAGFSKEFGTKFTIVQQGVIVAVPWVLAGFAMVLNARHSDKVAERGLHIGVPLIVAGCAIPLALYQTSPLMTMVFLSIYLMGFLAALPIIWTLPPQYLVGASLAGGVALINAMGNIGGFVGPYVTGWVTDLAGDAKAAMWLAGIVSICGGVGVIFYKYVTQKSDGAAQAAPRHGTPKPSFNP